MLESPAGGFKDVFWKLLGKRKVGCPSVQSLYENSSHLTRLDYRNQRDVLILVLSVTVIHPAKAGVEDQGELTL